MWEEEEEIERIRLLKQHEIEIGLKELGKGGKRVQFISTEFRFLCIGRHQASSRNVDCPRHSLPAPSSDQPRGPPARCYEVS